MRTCVLRQSKKCGRNGDSSVMIFSRVSNFSDFCLWIHDILCKTHEERLRLEDIGKCNQILGSQDELLKQRIDSLSWDHRTPLRMNRWWDRKAIYSKQQTTRDISAALGIQQSSSAFWRLLRCFAVVCCKVGLAFKIWASHLLAAERIHG